MNATPSQGVAKTAAQFSELIVLSAALGRGYAPPLTGYETPGMLFTSAVHPAIFAAFKRAEAMFVDWHDKRNEGDREMLAQLEASLTCAAHPLPGQRPGIDATKAKIKDLKKKLSLLPSVAWREHDAHKSTMLEMLGKSAYGSLTFIDEHGSRICAAIGNGYRLQAEASWLSLTNPFVCDVALIRSSSTGGATIHGLSGTERPSFSYVSQSPVSITKALLDKIKTSPSAASLSGHAIVVPVFYGDKPQIQAFTDDLFVLMKKVYADGAKPIGERLPLSFENPALADDWREFLSYGYKDFTGKDASESAAEKIQEMPASFQTMTSFATRAAFTYAILHRPKGDEDAVIITADHLTMAKHFAAVLYTISSGMTHLDVRSDNATKARSARMTRLTDPAVTAEACARMKQQIQASSNRMISRFQASSIPGMTLTVLDHLVSTGQFVELTGRDNIKMGTTERAYVLKEEAHMTAEEAMLELDEAWRDWKSNEAPDADQEIRAVYKELQGLAEQCNAGLLVPDALVPAVPVNYMTVRQIKQVPAILVAYGTTEVRFRNTQACPEPAHLIKRDGDEGAPFEDGVPNLWFRFNTEGKPFRDWKIAGRLGFPEWVEDKQQANQ